MAGVKQASKNAITLKGSTEIVAEFFHYGINSILYQRAIYPPETFKREQKYGISVMVTEDKELVQYLNNIMKQVKEWLMKMTVQKLVLVIRAVHTNEVLERWQFDVDCDKTMVDNKSSMKQKEESEVQKEIKAVIRQITSSVTFLPLLDNACAFDILVYTDKDLEVPDSWGESGPAIIPNSETVQLRCVSTNIHKVDTMVAYKNT